MNELKHSEKTATHARARGTQTTRFRLFRLTKPMQGGDTHAWELWYGRTLLSGTCRAVEVHDAPGAPARREFHGSIVEGAGASISRKTSPKASAAPEGSADLVAQAEGMPFDDPLPPF